ncbi:hypothetical protein PAPHI01_0217 [Pancytospora philotis]|nr:hypothetical protein PAPHI01_0217 [Pancytospora philotis]
MAVLISLANYPTLIRGYIEEAQLKYVNANQVLARISDGLAANMTGYELSRYCSEVVAAMTTQHSDYGRLASIILVSYHMNATRDTFSEKIQMLMESNRNLNPELYAIVMEHSATIDAMIDYARDYRLSYFAYNSMIRSYMLRIDDEPVERVQDVYMRTAIQLCRGNLAAVRETYDLISLGYYTHATPTLFNAMLRQNQLASCFLLTVKGDSIPEIFESIRDCAVVSKHNGGIGINLHEIRCEGSPIVTCGGHSKGIVPIMRIINETMQYVNHGGFKRNSNVAFYLEPWHKDILAFLDVRKNTGAEHMRAREVFTAIWMNDLFMERVEQNGEWSLFDPKLVPGLHDTWGEEFCKLYVKYEHSVSRDVINAQDLWKQIVIAQIETGTPYIVYKDTCNRLSNQSHLGTIKCSNLCAEIIEYSSKEETAVCNLASVCLPQFVRDGDFDLQRLRSVVHTIVRNLNAAIDCSFYPTPEARTSNTRHRPVGIGVQGLADAFIRLRLPYDSNGAQRLNKLIFETMYYAAIEASVDQAVQFGPHESFMGSKLQRGIFQWELTSAKPSGLWDWEELRRRVQQHGTRNSLFIALMPTAGTSQLFGNTECFEPITSNLFARRTIAGEFQVVNNSLMADLMELGLWSNEMRQLIIEYEGSIQAIPAIPDHLKALYKTVWEIKMKSVVDLAAGRQPYVDQSQSLNIFMEQPTYAKVSSMHFYGWRAGLKTGLYYLRSKPISSAIKYTVDPEIIQRALSSLQDIESSKDDHENKLNSCASCSC